MFIYCVIDTILTFIKSILLLSSCSLIILLIVVPLWTLYWKRIFAKKKRESSRKGTTIGIFHPYCNAGGGGERVLWGAIAALQKQYPNVHIAVYTGDLDTDPEQMLNKVQQTFEIELEPVEFIYLYKRKWVEADMYPRFTLLLQSLGSMYLGFEALASFQPDIYIDTMGYAFTYALFKYCGGCRVGSYTHYPTISTDMLRHVYRRVISHNNHRIIARNPFLSAGKIAYYKLFAMVYGWMGRCADIVIVNSSWTEEHINSIWKCPLKTHRVFPPCAIESLIGLPLLTDEEKGNIIRIISVAQFRPEKNHALMLRVIYELRSIIKEEEWNKIRLVFIGSCRNDHDKTRVKDMRDLSKHLAVDQNVEFKLNIPYTELIREFQLATIGLHAMWNEHFGISVVECMAAGLIMVAHDSGGPKADIVETQFGSQTGFLAWDPEEYAQVLAKIIRMHPEERNTIRQAARDSVNRFSDQQFEREFLRTVAPLFRPKLE